MEITVKSFEPKEAMSAYIRDQEAKHLFKGFKAVTFDGEKMIELVDLRIGATASTAYACVWFKGDKKWAYGSGKAGGYGYDKGSAAAEAAFRAAGMVTSGFGGTGCNREAVKAAGEYLSNGKPVFVVEFYG